MPGRQMRPGARHNIGAAKVLGIGENFMLHERSLHRGRAIPQALVCIQDCGQVRDMEHSQPERRYLADQSRL